MQGGKAAPVGDARSAEPAAPAPARPPIVFVAAPAATSTAAVTPAPPRAANAAEPNGDREAMRAADLIEWTNRIERHGHEARDASWASSTEAALRSELDGLGGDIGFQVRDIDCRTTTCVARLNWPSHGDALRQRRRVAQAAYSKECSREVYSPPVADGTAGPYEATVLFDCESDRANP
jgi:hypothetical protein